MTISFHSSGLLFGGRSHRSNSSDSDPTPKATQILREDSQATIKPLQRNDSQSTIRPSKQKANTDSFEMTVEVDSPFSPQSSTRASSWPTTTDIVSSANTGIQKVVDYFSPDEHSSEDERYPDSRQSKYFKIPSRGEHTTRISSRTHPEHRDSLKYQALIAKMHEDGKLPLHKFQDMPPEAKLVPHHLWFTDEERLPPRFKPSSDERRRS